VRCETLYDDGTRSSRFFGRAEDQLAGVIDTNEYLVSHGGRSALLDPGGIEVFPPIITAISQFVDMDQMEALFGSHQDPDVLSSLALWVRLCPRARVYTPRIWESFMRHYSADANFVSIPDEGGTMRLGDSSDLTFVPAHYLHSSANFSVYDPRAKILFSGDIGAALLPDDSTDVFVTDFASHVRLMEGFHRRWMPSDAARDRWVERVRALDVEMLCPQHGAVFAGEDVARFLEWFEQLELAGALGR
jgi:flavorubredoxin